MLLKKSNANITNFNASLLYTQVLVFRFSGIFDSRTLGSTKGTDKA